MVVTEWPACSVGNVLRTVRVSLEGVSLSALSLDTGTLGVSLALVVGPVVLGAEQVLCVLKGVHG